MFAVVTKSDYVNGTRVPFIFLKAINLYSAMFSKKIFSLSNIHKKIKLVHT